MTDLGVCRGRGECPLLELLAELPPNLAKDGRQIQALLPRKTPAAEIARAAESRARYRTARAAGTLIFEEER